MYSLLNLNTMARTGSIPIPFFFFYRRSYFNWLRPSNAVIIRICIVRTSAVFSGSDSDLVQLLEKEGYTLKFYPSVSEALQNAPEKSGVLLLSDSYPVKGTSISQEDESLIEAKSLRVLVEFPQRIGTTDSSKSDTLNLERIVVCDSINTELPFMSLLSFNRCILKETSDSINHPILVAAKVAGFDKAVYGLKDTETRPVLYYRTPHLLVSPFCLSRWEV